MLRDGDVGLKLHGQQGTDCVKERATSNPAGQQSHLNVIIFYACMSEIQKCARWHKIKISIMHCTKENEEGEIDR